MNSETLWLVHDPVDRVAFGIQGFPSDQGPTLDSLHLVPLTTRLQIATMNRGLKSHILGANIHLTELQSLQHKVRARWKVLTASAQTENLHHYFHIYSTLQYNAAVLRISLRKFIDEHEPKEVLIPEVPSTLMTSTVFPANLDLWSIYQVTLEETLEDHRLTYQEVPLTGMAASNAFRAIDFFQISYKLAREARSLVAQGRLKSRRRNPQSLGSRLLDLQKTPAIIVGQPAKVTQVLNELVDFKPVFIPLSEFRQAFDQFEPLPELRGGFGRNVSVEETIDNFVIELATAQKSNHAAALNSFGKNAQTLITDAIHNPIVRTVALRLLDEGKSVIVVPEGANSLDGANSLGGFDEMLYGGLTLEDPRVIRLVVTDGEITKVSRESVSGNSLDISRRVLSGYLGNTKTSLGLASTVLRRLESGPRFSWRQTDAHKKQRVLLTFDAFPRDSTFCRRFPNVPSTAYLPDFMALVDQIIDGGFDLVLKGRDRALKVGCRGWWPPNRAALMIDTPWQELIKYCSVLITRDSSLAWESISLGVPVVAWNFSAFPSYVETTLEGVPPDWARFATSPLEVVKAIQDLGGADDTRSEPPFASKPGVITDLMRSLIK